jgi:hypothetical protein
MDRLLDHWERLGAPIASLLQPGLTDGEIDERLAPTRLTLPDEARALFSWRNGTRPRPEIDYYTRTMGIAGWCFWSLEELVEWYVTEWNDWRDGMYDDLGYATRDDFWPEWFPVFRTRQWDRHLLIDCRHQPSYPNAVAATGATVNERTALKAFSLLALLETWVLWFDAGFISYDVERGRWTHDADALDWTTYRAAFF